MIRRLLTLTLVGWLSSTAARAADPVTLGAGGAFPEARQPQLAVDPAGTVYVVFGSGRTIGCAVSRDGGRSFADPVKVGEAGTLALGMRRGPRVAAAEKAAVVVAVCGEKGGGKDGDLRTWRSADGGKTWRPGGTVNSVEGAAREGLHHLAVGPDGTFYCVWMDLRRLPIEVYFASSSDGGQTWQNEKSVYASKDGACPCCQPSVACDPSGGVHVMWRNVVGGDRDMYVISSKDGGRSFSPPVKLGQDNWRLNICPMDGGALAADGDGVVQTVWRRNKELFRCAAGGSEERLGLGEQGWVTRGPDGFYFAWLALRPGRLLVLKPGAKQSVVLAKWATDPVLAAPLSGKGPVVAAWEEESRGARTVHVQALTEGR